MNITNITVRAGRTFNHPHEQYSNLRPEVEMSAVMAPGEDPDASVRALQAKAEALVEQHKTHLIEEIERLYESASISRELAGMEESLTRAQERMEDLKRRRSELLLPAPNASSTDTDVPFE